MPYGAIELKNIMIKRNFQFLNPVKKYRGNQFVIVFQFVCGRR